MSLSQGSLFGGPDAYGSVAPKKAPMAATDDPDTSHAAAARHEASGARNANCAIVLGIVKRKPGSTYVELFDAATMDEAAKLGSAIELMRRLSDLRHDKLVYNGPAKQCSIKGTSMMTWFPTLKGTMSQ